MYAYSDLGDYPKLTYQSNGFSFIAPDYYAYHEERRKLLLCRVVLR